jgi:hypothetical protein
VRKIGAVVVLLSVVGFVPTRATAFDLTGTWLGKVSCSGVLAGHKRILKRSPSTLLISQSGGLHVSADGIFYNGGDIADPVRPSRGELAVIRCGTSPNLSGGDFGGEFGRLKVTTNPLKGTGSLRGTSLRTDVILASSVYTCRWSYKRVNTDPPALDSCP